MTSLQRVILTSCYGKRFWRSVEPWLAQLRLYDSSPVEIISLDKGTLNSASSKVTTVSAPMKGELPKYGDGDRFRLERVVSHLRNGATCFQLDLDVRMKRQFATLSQLPYDFIVSRAFNFPKFAAERFGFVACTGFYIAKPPSLPFCEALLNCIASNVYGSSYDQYVLNALMWNAADSGLWRKEVVRFEDRSMDIDVFEITKCRIGILPREIVLRSADIQSSVFGNHDASFIPPHNDLPERAATFAKRAFLTVARALSMR